MPAVSVIELEDPNIATIRSFEFRAVTPAESCGVVAVLPLVSEAVPGYPAALSHTVNVPLGSSAPLMAMASPLAAVGVPDRVNVIVTEDRVFEAIPCHSSIDTEPAPGSNARRAEESNVMPVADRLETVIERGFSTITIRIESGLEEVESPVIVKVLPELQVPVRFALPFASMAGALPITIL